MHLNLDRRALAAGLALFAACARPVYAQDSTAVYLDSLNLANMSSGWQSPMANMSVGNHTITLSGKTYAHGVGTHATSIAKINLTGQAKSFQATVGLDDEANAPGSIQFVVRVDGKVAAQTPIMHKGDAPQDINVDLTGAKSMILEVNDGGDGIDNDHADWADAKFIMVDGSSYQPVIIAAPVEPGRLVILPDDPHPAIHGPKIMGTTPTYPFLYMIPATGDGPLSYSATGLPDGLTLDSSTGIISGAVANAGTYKAMLNVTGPAGKTQRAFTIVAGDHKLALTPPMGWNSWNVWAGSLDADKVRAAADELVSTGLAAHGYQYVNLDDTWEGKRDDTGKITSNSKFPDMKGLADYVHSKGLKIGIYSSPGPTTCAGYPASYQHEDQDAQSYADWGFDYLKYDWCSYGNIDKSNTLAGYEKPYAVMRASLDKVHRDIFYSFCQYGMGDVWKWGTAIGGNSWRTTGDINDSWGSLHGILESQAGHEIYVGPGHWNDPDMLVVGVVGWGNTHPSRLTQNEQILHISMWSLLSSPLLIGCDLTKLDTFTKAVLSNDEVLDISQDTLGRPGSLVKKTGDQEVWARRLSDGTLAVALVNNGLDPATVTANWSDIGASGSQPVRDLWLHKNVGNYAGSYSVEVPIHGVVLVKIGKPKD